MTFLESILDGFGKTFLLRFGNLDPVNDEVNQSFLFQFLFLFFPFVQPDKFIFDIRPQKTFLYQCLDHCWKMIRLIQYKSFFRSGNEQRREQFQSFTFVFL